MIDRHPALIVQCAGVADVITAVKFARANHLLVSVRGGGHNVAGFAVCEGGLMIDLSGMKSVWVDPVRQMARAEGGATWGDFDTAYTHRDAQYNVLIVGMWSNPEEDDKNIRWVRGLWEAMQPFASGEVYANYEADQGIDRVKAA
jgi:FAD binding domain